jgi:hypothetical protein
MPGSLAHNNELSVSAKGGDLLIEEGQMLLITDPQILEGQL